MLRNTRVSSIPDLVRLGASMARPGMDTRVWVSLARALGESKVDQDHGVFVQVQLLPTGEEVTARVPAVYAGKSFGLYAKIHEDDQVLVAVPSGDLAEGAVVINRLWSAADTPPQEAIDNEEEVLLVVEKDKTIRLNTSGSGKAYVKSEDTVTLDSPKVRLGKEDATEQYVLGTTYRQNESTLDSSQQSALSTATTGFTTIASGAGVAGGAGALLASAGAFMVIPIAGAILAAPLIAAAGGLLTGGLASVAGGAGTGAGAMTTMSANIATFEGSAASYLSDVTKGK